jgi:hypothetical protein
MTRFGDKYQVAVSPPEGPYWRSSGPVTAKEILEILSQLGCHSTDITDALYVADAEWPVRHDDEVRRLRAVRPVDEPIEPPWLDLRRDDLAQLRVSIHQELGRELRPKHPLSGQAVTPLAKCGHCDDVLLALPRSRYAVVHLTWAMQQETPPWPRTEIYENWESVLRELRRHAGDGLC